MSLPKKRIGKKRFIPFIFKFTAMLLLVCMLLPLISSETASANIPARRTMRIGLFWGNSAVSDIRLDNAGGFEWGWYGGTDGVNWTHGGILGTSVTIIRSGTTNLSISGISTINAPGTGASMLGVRPLNGAHNTTFPNNRNALTGIAEQYKGGFRFTRLSTNANITVVNIIELEEYVRGVVPYEMISSWPNEALKAQALAARTYALFRHNWHNSSSGGVHGFDLCTEMDCQVYRGRRLVNAGVERAVNETANHFITFNGRLVETVYVHSNGGASENSENIWSGVHPHLKGVMDPFEATITIPGYNWSFSISQTTLTNNVRRTTVGANASTIVSIWVSQYTPTGNVRSVTLRDANGREYIYSLRSGLNSVFGMGQTAVRSHRFNIGSTVWQPGGGSIFVNSPAATAASSGYFSAIDANGRIVSVAGSGMVAIDGSGRHVTVSGGGPAVTRGNPTNPVNGNFIITGTGWGHNVGMSQWGALAQANQGRSATQIIQFYYTGVQVTRG